MCVARSRSSTIRCVGIRNPSTMMMRYQPNQCDVCRWMRLHTFLSPRAIAVSTISGSTLPTITANNAAGCAPAASAPATATALCVNHFMLHPYDRKEKRHSTVSPPQRSSSLRHVQKSMRLRRRAQTALLSCPNLPCNQVRKAVDANITHRTLYHSPFAA